MRTLSLSLFVLLMASPSLRASENDPADAKPVEVVPSIVEQPAADAEARVQLKEVSLEKRATPDDAVAVLFFPIPHALQELLAPQVVTRLSLVALQLSLGCSSVPKKRLASRIERFIASTSASTSRSTVTSSPRMPATALALS